MLKLNYKHLGEHLHTVTEGDDLNVAPYLVAAFFMSWWHNGFKEPEWTLDTPDDIWEAFTMHGMVGPQYKEIPLDLIGFDGRFNVPETVNHLIAAADGSYEADWLTWSLQREYINQMSHPMIEAAFSGVEE